MLKCLKLWFFIICRFVFFGDCYLRESDRHSFSLVKMIKRIIIISCFLIIICSFSVRAQTGEIEVEVNTGPELTDQDEQVISYCVTAERYWTFFPMDFLMNGPVLPTSSTECPIVTFFGYIEEFCWVLDLFKVISPGITLSMFVYAIFHL